MDDKFNEIVVEGEMFVDECVLNLSDRRGPLPPIEDCLGDLFDRVGVAHALTKAHRRRIASKAVHRGRT
jgi:hypothetical protein